MISTEQRSNVDFASYHKKQLVRFCKKFHKDCYRLIGQKMALKDKVEELEQQIEQIQDAKCTSCTDLGGLQLKITELEKQIEKAVEIIRDLGGTVREGVTCHYLVDNGALHKATLLLKEIEK